MPWKARWRCLCGHSQGHYMNRRRVHERAMPLFMASREFVLSAFKLKPMRGRGHCVEFKTSAATEFVGQVRDRTSSYYDYIHLDMYWYPGGNATSTTCLPEGENRDSHGQWVYAFLSDPEDSATVSSAILLPYSCTTNTSSSHIFNHMSIGLTTQHRFRSDDISSYKALLTNFGVYHDQVNASITTPYARLSLRMKQQGDSWEIITESNPFAFAEMLGNIGGFWDLLLILWPVFFVTVTRQDPHLKPRNFAKSVARGAEHAGITKVITRPEPMRRSSSVDTGDATISACLEEGFQDSRRR